MALDGTYSQQLGFEGMYKCRCKEFRTVVRIESVMVFVVGFYGKVVDKKYV
jgi:hypothetical protein